MKILGVFSVLHAVCSLHRGEGLLTAGGGDAPSPLLIVHSLTGESLTDGAELLSQKALVEL